MGSFLTLVPTDGYRWNSVTIVEDELKGKKAKTARCIVASSAGKPGDMPARAYDPEEIPALFKHLTDLTASEEAISDFADKYGLLGEPVSKLVAVPNETKPGGDQLVTTGETLDGWSAAIHEMNELVKIWEWVRDRNVEELAKHIVWSESADGQFVAYSPKPMKHGHGKPSFKDGYFIIAHSGASHTDLIMRFTPGDVVGPGAALVRKIVNRNLKNAAYPQLLGESGNLSDFRLGLRPNGLLCTLWIQVAEAVAGNHHFRRCDHCDDWFRYEPGRGRFERRYCSQAHKVAAHRLSKKVDALRHEGVSEAKIVKRLGVTAERLSKLVTR